jgi:hypothetical protein
MPLALDHKALVEAILSDIAQVVADPAFQREEREAVEQLEANRKEWTDLIRPMQGLVERVRGAMRKGEPASVFVEAQADWDGPWQILFSEDFRSLPEDVQNQIGLCLAKRSELYAAASGGLGGKVLWLTNGEEYIFPFWSVHPLAPRETFATETWAKPSDRKGFPHHQVGYMLILDRLYDQWCTEASAMDGDAVRAKVVVEHKATHQHPMLPVKALMLDAVNRLPPVFFTLDKLRKQLDRITSVTIE